MTDPIPDDSLGELSALEQLLTDRIALWRVIVDEEGVEIGRYYRCSFPKAAETPPDTPSTS